MSKAILVYDLSDPDDEKVYNLAMSAINMRGAIDDFDAYLRQRIKYGKLDQNVESVLSGVRDRFWDIMNDNGVDAE